MDRDQAKKQWNSAAPGWAKWEPTIGAWLRRSTEAMLDAAGVREGARIVDIACGAGDQSLAAARRVGPGGLVLATDISEEMVGYVAQNARAAGLENLVTHCCAAEDLPADEPFDAAICRLGLMLLPDRPAAAAAFLRALRPGGRLGAIVVGAPAASAFLSGPLQILFRRAGKSPPPPGGPGIFALADPDAPRSLLQEAGFVDVAVTTLDEPLRMASATDAVQMIKDAFGVYRAIIGDQPDDVQSAAWAEVVDFLKGFEGEDGLGIPGQMHVIGAARPG